MTTMTFEGTAAHLTASEVTAPVYILHALRPHMKFVVGCVLAYASACAYLSTDCMHVLIFLLIACTLTAVVDI